MSAPDQDTFGPDISIDVRYGPLADIESIRLGGTAMNWMDRGALDGYSTVDRPVSIELLLDRSVSNDRGCLIVHPALADLAPGSTTTVGWQVFGHTGWDVFAIRKRVSPTPRIVADPPVAVVGETVVVAVAPAATGTVALGAAPVDRTSEQAWFEVRLDEPGTRKVSFTGDDGGTARAELT